MKRLLTLAVSLSLALAATAALAAPPPDKGKSQTSPAEAKAEKACAAERGTTAQSALEFSQRYGTNKNKKNAFGKCISSKSKGQDDDNDEADENKKESNASKKCKAERGTTAASIAAFETRHGTNENRKNAHGKCVSKYAKEKS